MHITAAVSQIKIQYAHKRIPQLHILIPWTVRNLECWFKDTIKELLKLVLIAHARELHCCFLACRAIYAKWWLLNLKRLMFSNCFKNESVISAQHEFHLKFKSDIPHVVKPFADGIGDDRQTLDAMEPISTLRTPGKIYERKSCFNK